MGAFVDSSIGLPFAVSLELPWLQNKERLSCIPMGIYRCIPKESTKFRHHIYENFKDFNCFEITDVPDRLSIEIHAGNIIDDTTGCICPGTFYGQYKDKPAVLNSRKAIQKLINVIGPEEFELIIK